MVSAELAKSGTAVAWAFSAIIPGASGVVAKTSGSVAASTMGSVSQVIVGPNSDITKTAIGHISVQYALIALWKVSEALNGHHTEAGIDRFIRLAGEQAMGAIAEYNEGADHWGFEAGTQSWVAANCSITQSAVTASGWPADGTHSLRLFRRARRRASCASPSLVRTSRPSPAGRAARAGSSTAVTTRSCLRRPTRSFAPACTRARSGSRRISSAVW